MALLARLFTWWNGATIGTSLGLRGKTRIGSDGLGNVYYEGGTDVNGLPRRWVIYAGANDASKVPPEWHGWLHHSTDLRPESGLPAPRVWEKPPVPNLTGGAGAYLPPGALAAGGRRSAATGDYEAWTPEQS